MLQSQLTPVSFSTVQGSRPGKTVSLLESEITGLCVGSREVSSFGKGTDLASALVSSPIIHLLRPELLAIWNALILWICAHLRHS